VTEAAEAATSAAASDDTPPAKGKAKAKEELPTSTSVGIADIRKAVIGPRRDSAACATKGQESLSMRIFGEQQCRDVSAATAQIGAREQCITTVIATADEQQRTDHDTGDESSSSFRPTWAPVTT
jgi:hypothetical protein